MRASVIATALRLLVTLAVAHAELLRVSSAAGIGQVVCAAREDNQVWMSGRTLHQHTDIDRDVAI